MSAPSLQEFQQTLSADFAKHAKGLVDPLVAEIAELKTQLEELHARTPSADLKDITAPPKAPYVKSVRMRAEEKNDELPGITVGRVARSLGVARGNVEVAHSWAKNRWGAEHDTAKAIEMIGKSTHLASDFEAGGAWLQPEFSESFVDTLRPQSIIRGMMGPGGIVGISNAGSLTWPRATGNTSAYWIGETQAIPVSRMSSGQITASSHKDAGLCLMSRELMNKGNAQVDVRITNNLTRSLALLEDAAFIRGLPGATHKPRGIRYWASLSNVLASTSTNSTPSLAELVADLSRMLNQLEESNVPRTSLGWIMSPRTKNVLAFARGSDGHEASFAQEIMQRGTLLGYPIGMTTQVPNNLGGSGDASELMLVDFAECVITDFNMVEIAVSDQATVIDGSTQVNTFQTDQMVIRAISAVDFTMLHPEAAVVLTGVKWATPPIG